MLPARFALYFRMRHGWKIHDPWGWVWLLRELVAGLPDVVAPIAVRCRGGRCDVADTSSRRDGVCRARSIGRTSWCLSAASLTIGHSYVVANNRRLAHEMALQGKGRWSVTAVAPEHFRGDMRQITIEPIADEASTLRPWRSHALRSKSALDVVRQRRRASDGDWDVVHCWEEPFVLAAAQIARASPSRRAVRRLDVSEPRQDVSVAAERVRAAACSAGPNGWIAFGETVHARDGATGRTSTGPNRRA